MPTEAETRHLLIDQQLARAGWDVSNSRQVISELALRYPTSSGIVSGGGASYTTEFADYALLDWHRTAVGGGGGQAGRAGRVGRQAAS